MLANEMLERFSQQSPVCVMVRATLENVLADERLDEIFPVAEAVCSEMDLTLLQTPVTLTVAGEIDGIGDEDIDEDEEAMDTAGAKGKVAMPMPGEVAATPDSATATTAAHA